MSKRLVFALAGLAAFSNLALAATPVVGDAEAGATKAATCAACHGMDGNSPAPNWPKLAGQHTDYTQRQAAMVRDGHREVIEMMPFVQGLSDQDLADIGAYYAAQTILPGVADDSAIVGRNDETYASLGQTIYRAGKPSAGVPACMACHGPTGHGVTGAGFPALAGQHGQYTAARLRFFHSGEHYGEEGDRSTIMSTIAQRLDETEIDAVATYIEGLHRVDPNAPPVAAVPAAPPVAVPTPTAVPTAGEPATGAAPVDPAVAPDGTLAPVATDPITETSEPAPTNDETPPADDDANDASGT